MGTLRILRGGPPKKKDSSISHTSRNRLKVIVCRRGIFRVSSASGIGVVTGKTRELLTTIRGGKNTASVNPTKIYKNQGLLLFGLVERKLHPKKSKIF